MGPNCKATWDREFLITNTLRTFVNGDYKTHREKLLMEQEKARFPSRTRDAWRVKCSKGKTSGAKRTRGGARLVLVFPLLAIFTRS